jgi:acyl dehydratase
MTTTLRFDDLAALQDAVSVEFGKYGGRVTVTQEMINGFAELTGDVQWIHVDVERSIRESPFGAPIAHGLLTLSLLALLADEMPVHPTGQVAAINFGIESLRFLAPVVAGSELHARARLAAVVQRSGGTLLTTEWDIRVVDAVKPSLVARMQVLYR